MLTTEKYNRVKCLSWNLPNIKVEISVGQGDSGEKADNGIIFTDCHRGRVGLSRLPV